MHDEFLTVTKALNVPLLSEGDCAALSRLQKQSEHWAQRERQHSTERIATEQQVISATRGVISVKWSFLAPRRSERETVQAGGWTFSQTAFWNHNGMGSHFNSKSCPSVISATQRRSAPWRELSKR